MRMLHEYSMNILIKKVDFQKTEPYASIWTNWSNAIVPRYRFSQLICFSWLQYRYQGKYMFKFIKTRIDVLNVFKVNQKGIQQD